MEMLRKDIRSAEKQLIAADLELTDEEARPSFDVFSSVPRGVSSYRMRLKFEAHRWHTEIAVSGAIEM